ncbi:cadherin domain-containing protein, partial [Azospirillum sp.]|uniref:cadherin domain-containing protein n=1 Tax=Azospirillum sp. TaxID=34012 RepID=UPI003D71C835
MPSTITGTSGTDILTGTSGDDLFLGLGGNDTLTGGDGLDTAVFAGTQADYDLTQPGVVTHTATGDTTTLSGIDQLRFDDTLVVLNTAPDAPADADAAANAVTEGAAVGTVVGVTARAGDAQGNALTYSLSDDAGGCFAIDATTGVVTVADGSLLDHESAASHTIVVAASDGSQTSTALMTIAVSNVNEGPSALADADAATNTVAENAATGTLVGITASALDPDAGDAITYSLSDDAGGRFAIDATTGVVSVADGSLLDYESAASHTITVQATDAGGLTSQQSVTIGIADANEAPGTPTDTDPAANAVAEGAAAGTVVGVTALALDPDAGATITYSLSDDAGGRFAIDAATGVVTVANGGLLDREEAASHTITVQASDGMLTATQSMIIGVSNVNEAPGAPADADAATNTVAENAATGTLVGITASALDPDAGDTLTYSLSDDAGGRFAIDATTGVVSVADGSLLDHESAASHTITVQATDAGGLTSQQSFTIAVTNVVEVQTYTGTADDDVATSAAAPLDRWTMTGLAGSDTLTGSNQADTLTGGAGDDVLDGDGGNDLFLVSGTGDGFDSVIGGAGTDTIRASADGTVIGLKGLSGVETITANGHTGVSIAGDGAANVLNFAGTALSGITQIDGGAGDDTITGSGASDWILGGADNDSLLGGGGADTLDGGTGSDTMAGGSGNDTYYVDAAADVVSETAGAGTDTVRTTLSSYTLGANVENLAYDGTGAFTGNGNGLDNRIVGGVSNDTLTGGAGVDTLIGGLGNDLYMVDTAGDVVTELAGEGVDTVQTVLSSYTLADHVETLTYIGTGAFTGTGNAGDNRITGGTGNDTLDGGAGADTLDGGAGSDTVSYATATTGVTVNLATGVHGGGATGDQFAGIEAFSGSAFNDSFTGDTGANSFLGGGGADTLIGGAGDDTLDGGTGLDSLVGGQGNDTFFVDTVGEAVVEANNEGNDTVRTTLNAYTLTPYVENLTFDGTGAFAGTGNALNNRITGGGGDDTLIGGGGADTLDGGAGSDTASYANATGNVTVNLATGVNGGDAYGDQFIGIEAFIGTAFNDAFTGDEGGNRFIGGAGSDSLYGNGGDDTLIGGAGADYILAGAGNDVIDFATDDDGSAENARGDIGNDTIIGGSGANILYGEDGHDSVFGGGGNDYMYGGAGNDTLDGGAGNDTILSEAGDDTILFTGGQDGVRNGGGNDVLRFAAGYEAANLYYTRTGLDLILRFRNSTDQVLLYDRLRPGASYVQTAVFADGTSVDLTSSALVVETTGTAGADTLDGFAYSEIMYGKAGNDSITGGDGNDSLYGGAGADTLYGGLGNDLIDGSVDGDSGAGDLAYGDTGNDVLIGSRGNDTLDGGNDQDTLSGGLGNDSLIGGAGSDVFRFAPGDGVDTIVGGLGDVLEVTGYDAAATYLSRSGDNLLVRFRTSTDTIVVAGRFSGDTGSGTSFVPTLRLADGTIIDLARTDLALEVVGTNTAETLKGYTGNDLIRGLAANDGLFGYGGNDTLIGGAGADGVYGGDGDDLIDFSADGGDDGAADGGNGNAGNDTVIGNNGNNILYGEDGNDVLSGNAGSDNLLGGTGNDTLTGGTGNDTLQGQDGDDVFIIEAGDGNDTIYAGLGTDTVAFGAGFSADMVSFVRSGGNLVVSFADRSEQVTLNSQFQANSAAERLRFADGREVDLLSPGLVVRYDGTDGADTLVGFAAADVIDGKAGNDVINGGTGNDTLSGGAGNDTLAGQGDNDTYLFNVGDGVDSIIGAAGDVLRFGAGLDPADLSFARYGNDLSLRFSGRTEGVLVYGRFAGPGAGATYLQTVVFADGTTIDLSNPALTLNTPGTAGADNFYGHTGNDTLRGAAGNDTLGGYGGNDLLLGGAGADSAFGGDGDDMIDFSADGGEDGASDIGYGENGNDTLIGNGAANLLYGGNNNDSLFGGAGNDTLEGNAGNDTLDGGAGNDNINSGAGDDVILFTGGADWLVNESGADTVRFGAGYDRAKLYFVRDGDHLHLRFQGSTDDVTIVNRFSN